MCCLWRVTRLRTFLNQRGENNIYIDFVDLETFFSQILYYVWSSSNISTCKFIEWDMSRTKLYVLLLIVIIQSISFLFLLLFEGNKPRMSRRLFFFFFFTWCERCMFHQCGGIIRSLLARYNSFSHTVCALWACGKWVLDHFSSLQPPVSHIWIQHSWERG